MTIDQDEHDLWRYGDASCQGSRRNPAQAFVNFQWYKVEDGKETAVGSATTKNQFNLAEQKLSAGNHTPSAFSATCDG